MEPSKADAYLKEITEWARKNTIGLLLVGSHARENPSQASDLDLIILMDRPAGAC